MERIIFNAAYLAAFFIFIFLFHLNVVYLHTNLNTMELKYGMSSTYKYELDKERLEWVAKTVNRSNGQVQFLFNLVDGDFEMLLKLESQIKNCHILLSWRFR